MQAASSQSRTDIAYTEITVLTDSGKANSQKQKSRPPNQDQNQIKAKKINTVVTIEEDTVCLLIRTEARHSGGADV